MSTKKKTKINRLMTQWITSVPAATSYLEPLGFKRDLLVRYKNSGWLEPFGRGAYMRSGDIVNWLGALYALQTQLSLPVHAGGKTALELKGYSHYLKVKKNTVFLYGPRGVILPSWFTGDRLNVKFEIIRTNLFPLDSKMGFVKIKEKDFFIKISSPERAAMEMLHLVPKKVGFDEANQIIGNLVALQPEVVQALLNVCRSIKVKRLFLYMAESHEHPWLSKFDLSKIDLGKGKRMIIPNGRYDSKYKITVPSDYKSYRS